MNEYTSLVSLLTSFSLFILAIAFFFGKVTSYTQITDKDRYDQTMDGLYFIFCYAVAPIALIAGIEIFVQYTTNTRLLTLVFSILLFIQFVLGVIILVVLLKIRKLVLGFRSLKTRRGNLLAKLTSFMYLKPYLRHFVTTIDIIAVYIFMRVYLSRQVFLLDMVLPTDYGMGVYVLSSIMITFVSFTAVRLISNAARTKTLDIVIQMDDKTTVSGQLCNWG